MLQKTTSDKVVRFKTTPRKEEFIKELRKRVNSYFRDNNISRYANWEMYLKTAVSVVAWAAVYTLIMSNTLSHNPLLLIAGFTLLGFVNIFIAFNIMHDACHNAYSGKKWVNRMMGYSFNFIGGNSYLFTRMHNAHHAYVNIQGIDVTLETHGLFRFTPHEPYKPIHRYQHIYTPILYALAMIHWVTVKDFKWFFVEKGIGNQKDMKHPRSEMIILFISKAVYFSLTLFLPLIFLDAAWWLILIAFVNIHILPSITFAFIFQVTHVYEGTHYPMPDNHGNIDNNYAMHVLETTADFSRKKPLGNFLMGAINIHVIHHIFPGICHTHYPKLTQILKETADEFGLEYQENANFWTAFKKHMRMLKHLSKPEAKVPEYGKSVRYA